MKHKKHEDTSYEPDYTNEPGEDPTPRLRAVKGGRRRKTARSVLRLLFVVILIAAVFLVYTNWNAIAPSGLIVTVQDWFSGSGEGFPVSISGGSVSGIGEINGRLAALSDTAFLVYSADGRELLRRTHSFTAPLLRTAGDYALIADIGGSRLRLETRVKTMVTASFAEKGETIFTVDVNARGDYAVVTDPGVQTPTTHLTVYNKSGKQIFSWENSKWLVSSICLRADSRELTAVGVTAVNGSLQTALLRFPLSGGDMTELPITTTALSSVHYLADNTLIGCGDTAAIIVRSGQTDIATVSYDGMTVSSACVNDNQAAFVLARTGSAVGGEVRLLSADGAVQKTAFSGVFRSVSSAQNGFWLLESDRLLYIGRDGSATSAEISSDGYRVCRFGNRAAVLGLTQLRLYDRPQ